MLPCTRRSALRLHLIVLAALCASTAAAFPGDEVGGSDAPPVRTRPDAPLVIRLGPAFGWRFLTEQSMSETYGHVAVPGLMCVTDLAHDSRLVLAAGYGFARGNPYLDVTGFDGANAAELTMVPLQVGLQSDVSPHPCLRILCGLSAESLWIRERLPVAALPGSPDHEDHDGWGAGLHFTFGPEWRTADDRRAFGFTMSWAAAGGEVHSRGRSHDVNLTGTHVQCHVLWRL